MCQDMAYSVKYKGDKTRNISDGQGRYTHQLTAAAATAAVKRGVRPSSLCTHNPHRDTVAVGPHLRCEPPSTALRDSFFYSSSSYFFPVFWLLLLRWPQIYKKDKDRLVSIWFPYMVHTCDEENPFFPLLYTLTREAENGHHHRGW